MLYTYPEGLVELVSLVAEVIDSDEDELLIAVVVGPVDGTRRDGQEVAFTEAVDLLVEVSPAKLAPPLFFFSSPSSFAPLFSPSLSSFAPLLFEGEPSLSSFAKFAPLLFFASEPLVLSLW